MTENLGNLERTANCIAYLAQYTGLITGVTAMAKNIFHQYYNHLSQQIDMLDVIKAPYTGIAVLGGLLFAGGLMARDYIKTKVNKREAEKLNSGIQLLIDSRLDSHKNRMNKALEEQRAFIIVYTKALESLLKSINNGTENGLEKEIKKLESMHKRLDSNLPIKKNRIYQEQY
ncbi:hypothetical protein HYV49_01715 [Candidatus Pacearchaeota archaeon]|nr:hypothetical protein [Candidatus Pacearchaeota archaeon]